MKNKMELKFAASLENESLARSAVSIFIAPLNPTLEEIGEIKTIVSEAVSNAIIHGYNFDDEKFITLKCELNGNLLSIVVIDYGKGIKDIDEAKTPHYSTRPDLERAGMGMTIMETLADYFEVVSVYGMGSKIIIKKELQHAESYEGESI